MPILRLFFFSLGLLLAFPALAAQDTLPPSSWQEVGPHLHAEEVMQLFVSGNHDKAFKVLFSRGRYPKDTLEKIQFDYFQMVKQQGTPLAFEKIYELKAGTTITRIKYVLLFKAQPMMFDLYYYKTEKGWLLKSFSISRDIKKVFER